MSKKLTTEEFIERARKVHGDKYDYSKVEYVNSGTKVCIICSKHGEFWQTPNMHLNNKNGCPKCGSKTLTQKEFIECARKVHGDKYDYSKVEYKGISTEVCIICPDHGEFWQTPQNHLRGGCRRCAGFQKDTSEFIKQARKVHGDKYDYSKSVYTKALEKIEIICSRHGSFWQEASSHLKGCGCIECSRESDKKTVEQFIEDAREVHGDKYDYSKVEYNGAHKEVCIICPEHGEFWQRPSSHISQQAGCPICSGVKRNTQKFIEDARGVHGDKYDYSKVNYENSSVKICIICPEHGEFWQRPNDHLSGSGCPECFKQQQVKTTKQFIEDAREIHGDKYDYSKVEYINSKVKVCIICPKHGEFWQTPNMHLRGNGCPKCSVSKGEAVIKFFLEEFTNLNFIYQYHSKWLGYQSLDFFFPEHNFGIEFDGEQHFRPVNFKGALTEEQMIKNFNRAQELDKLKDEKCAANGIKLFRIKYDEDIKESLTKILKLYNIEIKEESNV